MKISFTILGEPASLKNQRKLVTFGKGENKRPGFIKSEKARSFEKTALLQIPYSAKQMIKGPVKATIRIYYASERPDLDESGLLDIMQAKYETQGDERVLVRVGVYVNDRQVREKHIFHLIDRKNPRSEIEIEPLVAQQEAMALEVVAEGNPF